MKTFIQTTAFAVAVAAGGLAVTTQGAGAYMPIEKRVIARNDGVIPARPVQPRFGRGPIRDTMYRWYDPYGHHYGYYPPRYYPGMSWGGYTIFSRPVYTGSYAACGWARVFTPWGPRWRPVCL